MNDWLLRLLFRSRRFGYALVGAGLAMGAPVGLLIVRATAANLVDPTALLLELQAESPTYLYVLLSTLVVFASFGYALGRQADALVALSHTDRLTGLANRHAFEERLKEEIARSARYGEPLALLLVDVDGLKAINDRHGHHAGDLALQAVARALRSGARQADLPARFGGDEFAMLAPSTGTAAAITLGERIRSLVVVQGLEGLTVSVGVATLHPGGQAAPDNLRKVADMALYEAKRRGRNRVVVT